MRDLFSGIVLPICLSTAILLNAAPPPPPPGRISGIDSASLDPKCKPCDDFWRYVNGGWVDKNPIPARASTWGTLSVLTEANRERLRTILESSSTSSRPGSSQRKISDFYRSCMDTAAIDAAGIKPLRSDFDRINRISTPQELASVLVAFLQSGLARTERGGGGGIGPFSVGPVQDYKNSAETIAGIGAGGLSLPDRDYYFKTDDKSKKLRGELVLHVAAMLKLAGWAEPAEPVLRLETALAEATLTNVARRDPAARYHKMTWPEVAALAPAVDWLSLAASLNLPAGQPVNVTEPEFLKRLNTLIESTPISEWKTWLRWRVLRTAAPSLARPFADESFRYEQILTGVTEPLPRWQRCVNTTDALLGDALGEVFVAKHFPAEAQRRMGELVENLRATLKEQITTSDWMAPETQRNAIAKLGAFHAKIGFPERWRDYSQVAISPKTYFENVRSASRVNRDYQLAKIGKPLDRNDWGMTPPTVNAYYNSTKNEIAFPAGILQPPLFDLTADDAANYGAIGAVIGHEMGHGFDDQGSKFDAEGNLKNWWTPADRTQFEARAACVVEQFNTLDVGEGLRHNGKLVVGEALGDLGGLTLAFKAYQRSLGGQPAPVLEGFSAEQRFFLAFARVWGATMRPEAMRLRLNTDPHPLARFRANGTLQNMPEFHQAFQCKLGDAMVRPAAQRCKLW